MDVINLENMTGSAVAIGYAGENEAESVEFDFSSWAEAYGAGVLALRFQRPQESYPYDIALEQSGTTAVWLIDDTATAYRGIGKAQLHYTVGGVLKKSCVFPVVVSRSLTDAGSVPDPYEDWLVTLQGIADQGTAAAEAAEEARSGAEAAAENAGESAESACRSEEAAAESAVKAEGYALGTQGGEPVPEGSIYYHANAAYWAGRADASAEDAAEYARQVASAIVHFADTRNDGNVVITKGAGA